MGWLLSGFAEGLRTCSSENLCVPAEECSDYLDARAMLEEMDKSTPERAKLLKELRDLVCDIPRRRICCEGKISGGISQLIASAVSGVQTIRNSGGPGEKRCEPNKCL